MSTQKILTAGIAGGLALFACGAIFYLLIFGGADFFLSPGAESSLRDPMALWAIIIMEVLYGCLLALIFGRWAGIKTFAAGLKAGALIGLIIGLCVGLEYYAETVIYNISFVVYWGVTWAIRWAVAGGVVGWVLGRGSQG